MLVCTYQIPLSLCLCTSSLWQWYLWYIAAVTMTWVFSSLPSFPPCSSMWRQPDPSNWHHPFAWLSWTLPQQPQLCLEDHCAWRIRNPGLYTSYLESKHLLKSNSKSATASAVLMRVYIHSPTHYHISTQESNIPIVVHACCMSGSQDTTSRWTSVKTFLLLRSEVVDVKDCVLGRKREIQCLEGTPQTYANVTRQPPVHTRFTMSFSDLSAQLKLYWATSFFKRSVFRLSKALTYIIYL